MALDDYSFRLGVIVSLQVRLFDAPFEQSPRIRAKVGPADLKPSTPELVEVGNPGEADYQRIWHMNDAPEGASEEATAASSGFVKFGSESFISGFEPPPLPDATAPMPSSTAPAPTDSGPLDGGRGPAITGAAGDEHVAFFNIVPEKVRWRNNAHRVPDELDLELPLAAFPVPPDGSLVRAILVEMRRVLLDADGLPVAPPSDEPDFAGFVDRHRIRMSSSAASIVHLPCRDMAGVAADTKCRGREIESDLPVDEAIARFLTLFAFAVGLRVIWKGSAVPPTIGAFGPKSKKPKHASKGGKHRHTGGATRPPKTPNTNVLEAISEYCTLAAVTPSWVGYDLILAPASTLDRDDADQVPYLLLGANVQELELEHRLAQSMTRAVEVRSFNPDTGKLVIGRYPADPTILGELAAGASNKAAPTGPLEVPPGAAGVEEKGPHVQTVYGLTDPAQAGKIAENIFNELARQDLSGKAKTKEIATVQGRAKGIADLLELRAGKPLGIHIAPSVEASAGSFIQRLAAMSRSEAIAFLIEEQGYVSRVAEKVVDGILSVNRPFTYRVREIDFTWGARTASEFEISLINFIESIEEQVPNRKGGARRALMQKGGGNFVEKWQAIENDMLAGEISPADATRMMKDVGEAERRARGLAPSDVSTSGTAPTSSAVGAKVTKAPGTASSKKLAFTIGF